MAFTISFQNVAGTSNCKTLEIAEFVPTKHDSGRTSSIESQYVLFFSINRTLNYKSLDSIPKDSSRENRESAIQLHHSVENSDFHTSWGLLSHMLPKSPQMIMWSLWLNCFCSRKRFVLNQPKSPCLSPVMNINCHHPFSTCRSISIPPHRQIRTLSSDNTLTASTS